MLLISALLASVALCRAAPAPGPAPTPARKLLQASNPCFCLVDTTGTLFTEAGAQPQAAAALSLCRGSSFVPHIGVVTSNATVTADALNGLFPEAGFEDSFLRTGVSDSKAPAYSELISASGAQPTCAIVFDRRDTRAADAATAGSRAFVFVDETAGLTSENVTAGEALVDASCACYAA